MIEQEKYEETKFKIKVLSKHVKTMTNKDFIKWTKEDIEKEKKKLKEFQAL